MREFSTIEQLRSALGARGSATLGFVPTMGNLHAGHLALVQAARKNNDINCASIFVNPLQFGANEDLDAYPRTLDEDRRALAAAGCDILFLPSAQELYGADMATSTRVHVPNLGESFCGSSRPGHFDGVSTIVTKLFNIVQPTDAYFGLKDFQQYAIIRKMTADLALPITIHGLETIRAPDGLALSSRNGYLSAEQRAIAPALFRIIQDTGARIKEGEPDLEALCERARTALSGAGLRPDYFGIAAADTLTPAQPADSELVILAAAFLGSTRLIDNLRVSR